MTNSHRNNDPREANHDNSNSARSTNTDDGTGSPYCFVCGGVCAHVDDFRILYDDIDALAYVNEQLGEFNDQLTFALDFMIKLAALNRRRYDDLVAAVRAALLARAEGEPDALWYLRDALPPAPPGHPLNDTPDAGGAHG